MIDKLKCKELLKRYLDGNIEPVELDELFKMSADSGIEELIAEMIDVDYKSDQQGDADLPPQVSEQILGNILASEKITNRLFVRSKRKDLARQLSAAAIFLILITGVVFYYFKPVKDPYRLAFEAFVPVSSVKKINNTSATLLLSLEDGSTIRLAPKATLSFPKHFVPGKREVYLTGDAFFEITKNPKSPFYVYYNNIITRVLGTSFNIKTNPSTNNFEVSVITGKVQVTENKYLTTEYPSNETMASVIVIPNQKALYNSKRRDFETTLADSIHQLVSEPETLKYLTSATVVDSFFYHKATNLRVVFAQLEKVYGVEIIVDNENIYNCVFSGDISKQDMWKKLNIICLTVGSTFEVKGTKILVSGNGCN